MCWIILLNEYMQSISFDSEFKDIILKMLGNILIINGYIKDIPKLINAFLKIIIWVFW